MKTKTLQQSEAAKIYVGLRPSVDYLHRLYKRMQASGFAADDPIYVSVRMTYEAILALSQEMHRRGCEGWGGGSVK